VAAHPENRLPWTVAHAAAVLPLRRARALPFSALVAGSMAPDLGYYIGRSDLASATHHLGAGTVLLLPVGFAMLAAWRALGPAMCAALPSPLRDDLSSSFEDIRFGSLRGLLLACLALAIGSFTHIAWDAFTHAHGWFVYHTPAMRAPVQLGDWYTLPRYRLLQHLSTLAGVFALLVAWRRVPRSAGTASAWAHRPERLRTLLVLALLLAAAGATCLSVPVFDSHVRFEDRVWRIALVAPAWFGAFLCLAGILIRRRQPAT